MRGNSKDQNTNLDQDKDNQENGPRFYYRSGDWQ